jgi:hypothetical protein
MGLLFGFIVLIACFAALAIIYSRQQVQAQSAEFAPPIVLVTEPESVPAGSYLPISATAFGTKPIMRVELWVDGELKETLVSDQPEGSSPFYADFSLLMTEGPHMLFVRAVNTASMIGQSPPLSIVALRTIRVNTGETLEDIARSLGVESQTLHDLNPDLKGEEPAVGKEIQVPGNGVPAPVPGSGQVQTPNVPMLKPMPGTVMPVVMSMVKLVALFETTPPAAPSNLQAKADGCKVTLVWDDNATNEERYNVWMSGWLDPPPPNQGFDPSIGFTPKNPELIATLNPASGGSAWTELYIPYSGQFYFWVEAVNSYGKKPSNFVYILVNPKGCGVSFWFTHLSGEFREMTVVGNYDKVYCYASFEGAPEARLPEGEKFFGPSKANKVTIPVVLRNWTVPTPADWSLDIATECWGWAGATLTNLGTAKGTYPVTAWNEETQSLVGSNYEFRFTMRPGGIGVLGSAKARPMPAEIGKLVVTNHTPVDAHIDMIPVGMLGISWSWASIGDVAAGKTRTWLIPPGQYDFNASHGKFILEKKAGVNISGKYHWTIPPAAGIAKVNVYNQSGRPIDAVYFRQSGQPAWSDNLLVPIFMGQFVLPRAVGEHSSNFMGPGETRTFEVAVGNYDLRTACCGKQVLDEKLNVVISGTYDWNVLAALDVYNRPEQITITGTLSSEKDKFQIPINELFFIPGGPDQLAGSDPIKYGNGRRFYLPAGAYSLKAKMYGAVKYCSGTSINGVVAWYVGSETYVYSDPNGGGLKSSKCVY